MTTKLTIQKGDCVIITKNTSSHHFSIGEIVYVLGTDPTLETILASNFKEFWYIGVDEYTPSFMTYINLN
ncbi:MAG: hypothetical protein WC554_07725 [Clostridia bacterium]